MAEGALGRNGRRAWAEPADTDCNKGRTSSSKERRLAQREVEELRAVIDAKDNIIRDLGRQLGRQEPASPAQAKGLEEKPPSVAATPKKESQTLAADVDALQAEWKHLRETLLEVGVLEDSPGAQQACGPDSSRKTAASLVEELRSASHGSEILEACLRRQTALLVEQKAECQQLREELQERDEALAVKAMLGMESASKSRSTPPLTPFSIEDVEDAEREALLQLECAELRTSLSAAKMRAAEERMQVQQECWELQTALAFEEAQLESERARADCLQQLLKEAEGSEERRAAEANSAQHDLTCGEELASSNRLLHSTHGHAEEEAEPHASAPTSDISGEGGMRSSEVTTKPSNTAEPAYSSSQASVLRTEEAATIDVKKSSLTTAVARIEVMLQRMRRLDDPVAGAGQAGAVST